MNNLTTAMGRALDWYRELPLAWERPQTRAAAQLFAQAYEDPTQLAALASNAGVDTSTLNLRMPVGSLVRDVFNRARGAERLEELFNLLLADSTRAAYAKRLSELVGHDDGIVSLRAGSKRVAALLGELEAELTTLRQTRPGSEAQHIRKRGIDSLVDTIKREFQPQEDSVVAGARLVRVIGNGNFGTVWEGLDPNGRSVAVKVFHLHRLAEGHMLARFRRSIRAMRILSEPRRLQVYDDGRAAVVPFYQADESELAFSMKLLTGGDLEKLEYLGWSLEKKLEVFLSVCASVRYAHVNGVIHRDIKPANIVLDEDGKAVLTDFDIADIKFSTRLSTTVEKSLGTPVFAAPEQLENAANANELADIYSLGRLLYFFLLERSPGYQIERDPSLENIQHFPAALVEIVRQATQYDPAKRFRSVVAMILTLERCQTGYAARAARLARLRRWVRRNRWILALAIVTILAAVAFATSQTLAASEQRRLRVQAEQAMAEAVQAKAEAETLRTLAEQANASLVDLTEKLRALTNRTDDLTTRRVSLEAKLSTLQKQHAEAPPALKADLEKNIAETRDELAKVREILASVSIEKEELETEFDDAVEKSKSGKEAAHSHNASRGGKGVIQCSCNPGDPLCACDM